VQLIRCAFPGSFESPGYIEELKTKREPAKLLEEEKPETTENLARFIVEGLKRGEQHIPYGCLGQRISSTNHKVGCDAGDDSKGSSGGGVFE